MKFFKRNWSTLLAAIVFTALFFLPFILDGFGKHAGFFYIGDVANLWIPQIMEILDANKHYIFNGIDMYTQNGASEIFLRPNLLVYSPFVLLGSQTFTAVTPDEIFRFFFIIYIVYTFLACFFIQKLCEKYFSFSREVSLFVVAAFCFSITVIRAYRFPPFLFAGLIFPSYLYVAIYFGENRTWREIIGGSFIVTLGLEVGYVCFSGIILILTAVFICIWWFYITRSTVKSSFYSLLRSSSPFAIAIVVHVPLYIAYFNRIRTAVMSTKLSLSEAAFNHALIPSEIFGLLSHHFSFQTTYIEQQIVWGVLPVTIIILSIFFLSKFDFSDKTGRLLITSTAIYFLYAVCLYGTDSAASYLFYYSLPVVGEMHFYQRYLVVISLFFWIIIAIFLSSLSRYFDTNRNLKSIRIITFIYIIAFFSFANLVHFKKINLSEPFLFEFLLSTIFVGFFIFFKSRAIVILALVISIIVPLASFYDFARSDIWKQAYQTHENIVFNNAENERLINYFKSDGKKKIRKYIDLINGLNMGYLPKNYPWWVNNRVQISAYLGYDMHLAANRNYQSKFSVSRNPVTDQISYDSVDWGWLKKTGADFVVFDVTKSDESILQHIDKNSILRLSHNIGVAQLQFHENIANFDNGYFRIYNSKNFTVSNFETNNYGNFNFQICSLSESKIAYLFWPNQHLNLYIDGERKKFDLSDGLYTFKVPAGEHNIEIKYNNIYLSFFIYIYFAYLFVCIISLFLPVILVINPCLKKIKS